MRREEAELWWLEVVMAAEVVGVLWVVEEVVWTVLVCVLMEVEAVFTKVKTGVMACVDCTVESICEVVGVWVTTNVLSVPSLEMAIVNEVDGSVTVVTRISLANFKRKKMNEAHPNDSQR